MNIRCGHYDQVTRLGAEIGQVQATYELAGKVAAALAQGFKECSYKATSILDSLEIDLSMTGFYQSAFNLEVVCGQIKPHSRVRCLLSLGSWSIFVTSCGLRGVREEKHLIGEEDLASEVVRLVGEVDRKESRVLTTAA